VSGPAAALWTNAAWEVVRLRRSRRIWLLVIPMVAGPVGSAIADLYLAVGSVATAQVLGYFIVAGLASLVILDLTALSVGEDLALKTDYLTFALPQPRGAALAGRLLVVVGGALGGYAIGAAGVATLSGAVVRVSATAAAPPLIPLHLALGAVGLLLYLGGVTAAAAVVTRSASQALVAGVLAGVVAAGVGSLFLVQARLTVLFPWTLGGIGAVGFLWCFVQYHRMEG
jgi:hypothetical protein